MKTNNAALPVFGLSLKSAINYHKSSPFIFLLIALFLFLASFAGDVKKNETALAINEVHAPVLKSVASPLTGPESIRTNLYLLMDNNTTILADGVLTEYNNLYHDSVTLEDAYKFTNINENLGLSRYGRTLAVERRPVILASDTLYFKLWKTTKRNYQLEFVTTNLNHPGMKAFLEDAYLGTSLLLALNGTTKLNFSINDDAASGNINRFRIVYHASLSSSVLPVSFSSVKGYQLGKRISIDWKVENEINIRKYEVERSVAGADFIKVNSITIAGLNHSMGSYSWVDEDPAIGNNFYRIKSVGRDASIKFSLVVKVATIETGSRSITIYPNPIRGNMVNIQFTNQQAGIYQVRLISNSGQVVYSGSLPVSSSNISQTIFTNKNLAGGLYQLEIKGPDNKINIQKAIVQE